MEFIRQESENTIARLGPGDYFGDISVLLNTPRATDAKAVTALELYILKKTDFVQVIHCFPNLLEHFKSMAENSLSHLKLMVKKKKKKIFAFLLSNTLLCIFRQTLSHTKVTDSSIYSLTTFFRFSYFSAYQPGIQHS